eukprot:scaffold118932_cov19-Tisochrysis_lutea.AAC.1
MAETNQHASKTDPTARADLSMSTASTAIESATGRMLSPVLQDKNALLRSLQCAQTAPSISLLNNNTHTPGRAGRGCSLGGGGGFASSDGCAAGAGPAAAPAAGAGGAEAA